MFISLPIPPHIHVYTHTHNTHTHTHRCLCGWDIRYSWLVDVIPSCLWLGYWSQPRLHCSYHHHLLCTSICLSLRVHGSTTPSAIGCAHTHTGQVTAKRVTIQRFLQQFGLRHSLALSVGTTWPYKAHQSVCIVLVYNHALLWSGLPGYSNCAGHKLCSHKLYMLSSSCNNTIFASVQ